MITFGNQILYVSIVVSAIALLGLLLKEFKKGEIVTKFVTPAILLSAGLFTFAYLLLTYYFAVSDFTYEYVWEYSSIDLPMIYKLSGTWAGQPGTYLLWVWVIFLSAAWLAVTTKHSTPLARRTQIITLIIGIYFTVLTLIQTPFKSIYELPNIAEMIASGSLPANFVPEAGNGLNALLVNFWMIVHPPLMFIGYATMTIPFAAAIVYLLTKEEGWEELGRQWARFTWLVLGMGIAVGGVWAYFILGWGGFWAWDPVETVHTVAHTHRLPSCYGASQEEQEHLCDSCANAFSGLFYPYHLCSHSGAKRSFQLCACFWRSLHGNIAATINRSDHARISWSWNETVF